MRYPTILLQALLITTCGNSSFADTSSKTTDLEATPESISQRIARNKQQGGAGTPRTSFAPRKNGPGTNVPETNVPETITEENITNKILTSRATNCSEYVKTYTSSVKDVQRALIFEGNLEVKVENGKCKFNTNAIPNHDFNDDNAHFATTVSEQNSNFEVTQTPTKAASTTSLSLQLDNALFLNGVKLDLLAAGCYGVGDGRIGCGNMASPFRYDPMSPLANFGTDSHNAHTQPDGTYHYHGNPNALFYSDVEVISPVIGFAADGFPIYGSYFDDNGTIRKATSSYQLKSGAREAQNGIAPGGTYDGTYVDDYTYSANTGDLDECNGMTVNGNYGYYVTDAYPWVLGCFSGTPDSSFSKR